MPPLFSFWLEVCAVAVQTVNFQEDTKPGVVSAVSGLRNLFAMLTGNSVYVPTQDLGGWQQKALTTLLQDLLIQFETQPSVTHLGVLESLLLASHIPFQGQIPRVLLLAFKVNDQGSRLERTSAELQQAVSKFCCLLLLQYSKVCFFPRLLGTPH